MKTRILFIGILAIASLFTSCKKDSIQVIPSSKITSIEKSIAVHQKLDVSSPFRVFLTFSDTEERFTVEANENLHSYIQLEDINGWLKISLKDEVNITSANMVLNIYISTKNINEYQVEGAAAVILENELFADELNIELMGASSFTGSVQANNIYTTLVGASIMEVSGSAALLNIKAGGGCSLKNYDMEIVKLEADLNGASNVYLSVMESLKVKASGASNVYYKGGGVIESQVLEDVSSIIKMD